MSRRLVGDDVDRFVVVHERLEKLDGVGFDSDRLGHAVALGQPGQPDGIVDVRGDHVEVARLDPPVQAGGVDVGADDDPAIHGHGQRLGPAHTADAGRQRQGPGQGSAETLGGDRREGLVGALQDALGADVDPRSGCHLPVHGEPELLEAAELVPVVPLADQVAVGDQDPGSPFVGAQDADRPAGLDEQRLVVGQLLQGPRDGLEAGPVARRFAAAAVDDQIVGALGDVGVEVVVQHPPGGFLGPGSAVQLASDGRPDRSVRFGHGHGTSLGLPGYEAMTGGRRPTRPRPRSGPTGPVR